MLDCKLEAVRGVGCTLRRTGCTNQRDCSTTPPESHAGRQNAKQQVFSQTMFTFLYRTNLPCMNYSHHINYCCGMRPDKARRLAQELLTDSTASDRKMQILQRFRTAMSQSRNEKQRMDLEFEHRELHESPWDSDMESDYGDDCAPRVSAKNLERIRSASTIQRFWRHTLGQTPHKNDEWWCANFCVQNTDPIRSIWLLLRRTGTEPHLVGQAVLTILDVHDLRNMRRQIYCCQQPVCKS